MLKKIIIAAFSVISLSAFFPAYADGEMNCTVQVAVATPPIQLDQNVAFNVTNENGFNRSITLKGGSGPQSIEQLPCSPTPFNITATSYSTPSNQFTRGTPIGQCILKAGSIYLNGPENSISVVFPYDFNC